jgi:hypothetical protein
MKIEEDKCENQTPEPNVLGLKGDMRLKHHDHCIPLPCVVQCVLTYIIKSYAMCSTEKQGSPVSNSSRIPPYFDMSSN